MPKPAPKTTVEPEVGCRADGPYLLRLRVRGLVDIRCQDGLTCIDINADPEQLRQLGILIARGADQPRPDLKS